MHAHIEDLKLHDCTTTDRYEYIVYMYNLYGHVQSTPATYAKSADSLITYMYSYLFFLPAVDARMFTLPNGSPIYVFVREGLVYIPNPELAKILPAVSRTAMENIRNSYGITVYQVRFFLRPKLSGSGDTVL